MRPLKAISANPTYFFDVCLGKRIPQALQTLRPPEEIRYHLGENFDHAAPDDEWLSVVGTHKWIVISQDTRFHRNEAAIAAIKQHSVGCFYISGANSTAWATSQLLISQWDRIREITDNEKKPFIYKILRNQTVVKVEFPL
jgi:hypothetical protein